MNFITDQNLSSLKILLDHYGLNLEKIDDNSAIPYSFWGTPEAGRLKNNLYMRSDTPTHSILHEACHFICMPERQRDSLSPDAAGSSREENATCYLQLLLSDKIDGFSQKQHMQDMDEWGYSFRLGSSTKWFYQDAEDAKETLIEYGIIDYHENLTWKLRS